MKIVKTARRFPVFRLRTKMKRKRMATKQNKRKWKGIEFHIAIFSSEDTQVTFQIKKDRNQFKFPYNVARLRTCNLSTVISYTGDTQSGVSIVFASVAYIVGFFRVFFQQSIKGALGQTAFQINFTRRLIQRIKKERFIEIYFYIFGLIRYARKFILSCFLQLVGHVIKGGGIAISGQEQRQLGGGFLEGKGAPPGKNFILITQK